MNKSGSTEGLPAKPVSRGRICQMCPTAFSAVIPLVAVGIVIISGCDEV
jgi:hypothetical protein